MDSSSGAAAGAAAGAGIVVFLIYAVIIVLMIASLWKVFVKAGQPGWAAIIPIYNAYVLCEVAGKPGWWVILCFIPVVNIIIAAMVSIGVAENFGKSAGFGIGLWLLGIIFYPMLAFSDAQYQGGVPQAPVGV